MNIESALTLRIGSAGAKLHTARSRNDQVALDMRLFLRHETDEVRHRITALQRALIQLGGKNKDAILPGYTHLQRAQPVLFAHHLLAYVEMLQRDEERLADARKRINRMPLGSGAIAGSTIQIDREYIAQLLGFPEVTRNSMDAVSDRDFVCEFLFSLSLLGVQSFSTQRRPDPFCFLRISIYQNQRQLHHRFEFNAAKEEPGRWRACARKNRTPDGEFGVTSNCVEGSANDLQSRHAGG